jgi:hypothetical protein
MAGRHLFSLLAAASSIAVTLSITKHNYYCEVKKE